MNEIDALLGLEVKPRLGVISLSVEQTKVAPPKGLMKRQDVNT